MIAAALPGTAPRFRVRRPVPADARGIAAVVTDGWRETYGHLVSERFYNADALAAREARWTSALQAEPVAPRFFVGESEGRVVGVAYADSSSEAQAARPLTLYLVYVHSAFHGSGLAQELLDATLNGEPAQLWCAKENPRAIAFYAKTGFLPDGAVRADPDIENLVEIRLVR